MRSVYAASAFLSFCPTWSTALVSPVRSAPYGSRSLLRLANSNAGELDLKSELTAYLQKRKEVNADEMAKSEVGKIVGGTKNNAILEYVSGAPNKPTVIEEEPNIFDYDQLTKFGFGHLVTPIMNSGGRVEMYKLMDMEPPTILERIKPKSAPKLVIDRTGETDQARYSGLKMGQVLDDDAMAQALEEANRRKRAGEELRPRLVEEDYVMPFADKRNVGPKMTPDWTPEMLDEEGRKRGQAQAWARKAKAGEFVKDPFEGLTIEGPLRVYSVMGALLVSFAFGRSTDFFLTDTLGVRESVGTVEQVLQAPALALLLVALGSSAVSSIILAPQKNRSAFVWGVKGFFGGPVAIVQLRDLGPLQTEDELEQQENQAEA